MPARLRSIAFALVLCACGGSSSGPRPTVDAGAVDAAADVAELLEAAAPAGDASCYNAAGAWLCGDAGWPVLDAQ